MHPPGTIVVPSGDLARYADFFVSLARVQLPPGTLLNWQTGPNVAQNINAGIRHMQGEWVWLLGDDHTFPPDALLRLLDHNVPVVTPLVRLRKPPFPPSVFRKRPGDPRYLPVPLQELPLTGLTPIEYCGCVGMLLRKEVINAVGDPWYEVGKIRSDVMGEDLYFCSKVRAAGYQILLDMDTVMGHTTTVTILPMRHNTVWSVGFHFGPDIDTNLPCIIQVPDYALGQPLPEKE